MFTVDIVRNVAENLTAIFTVINLVVSLVTFLSTEAIQVIFRTSSPGRLRGQRPFYEERLRIFLDAKPDLSPNERETISTAVMEEYMNRVD